MTATSAVMRPRLTTDPEIAQAFPNVDPGVKPTGSRVLVQFRRAKSKSTGGIILVEDTRETEKYNTQTAKIVAVGPLAFRHRDSGQPWHEGAWCEVGDFVRISKFGGDRWAVQLPGGDKGEEVIFGIFEDHNVVGLIEGDPLAIKAFI